MSLSASKIIRPDFAFERAFEGPVCGIDEAGRGPLAGPVVAACVYIPEEKYELEFIPEITDSKQLTWEKLEELYSLITEHFHFSIAESSTEEIDDINILQATMQSMRRAFEFLKIAEIAHALVDGNQSPKLSCSVTPIVMGDSKSVSIAAASILAKVHRDRLMEKLAEEHPHYGWEHNAGYSTKAHLDAIDKHGITTHHRKSFAPVRNFIQFGCTQRQIEMAV